MFIVEKLNVYNLAVSLGCEAIRATKKRRTKGFGPLLNQFLRAATSVALNIAEANGRSGTPDKRQFLHIARGSLYECLPLIEFLVAADMLERGDAIKLKDGMETISKMLNGLLEKRWASNKGEN